MTQVTATDQDNQTLTYQIIAGADFDKFQINASTGQLTFKSAPDFEAPTDGNHDNNYQVQVGAFDGIDFGIQTITVAVTDVNETQPDDYRDILSDSSAPLGQVAVGGSTTGVIVPKTADVNGDKDVFAVTLQQGHVYKISVNGEAVGGEAALADTYFTVRGSDFNTRLTGLYSNSFDTYDNAGGSNNAVVEFGATQSASNQYYIVVGAGGANFASAHGGYRLQVDDVTASEPGGTTRYRQGYRFRFRARCRERFRRLRRRFGGRLQDRRSRQRHAHREPQRTSRQSRHTAARCVRPSDRQFVARRHPERANYSSSFPGAGGLCRSSTGACRRGIAV